MSGFGRRVGERAAAVKDNMFKFLKKHPAKDSEERERLKKELFEFRECVDHGFPSKPSAIACDQKLRIFAVGTKNGVLRVYGAPGVEFSAVHANDVSVNQIFFLPSQGRLITLCSDNTLHLWEINLKDGESDLEELKELTIENSKQKAISTCCMSQNSEELYIGTEGGNIYLLDIKTFQVSDQVIYQDVIMQNVPDDFKVDPGAVEAIALHPSNQDKVLIGYNRGLIVLWDSKEGNAEKTYNASQQLDSVCWHRSGEQFMSAHSDGSYIIWNATDCSSDSPTIPYGPFPCKAISKIEWLTSKLEPFIIFSGGMPRASYGDRHTVTCMQDKNHVVFDFTSRVVDFVVLTRSDECDSLQERSETDEPHALVVLAEEELVILDLESDNWPAFRLPYLHSLHSSAITCSQHVANIPDQLWQKITDAGESQMNTFSQRDWPINGGKITGANSSPKDLLLTGHEDGTVRFWDASGTSMMLLYKLSTATSFSASDANTPDNNVEEEEWPPFRKVGCFDPYSDDPRLGIQKICLCPLSETLAVAGTAGQIITLQMEREERTHEVKCVTVNVVGDRDGFVWKGHEALTTREGEVKFTAGFQPTAVMQLYPPAACTAISVHTEWQLVAVGTAHGLGVFDYAQQKEVMTKCTLNASDLSGTSETPLSRRQTLKKSLRESFRRLRKRRSERRQKAKADKHKKEAESPKKEKPQEEEAGASAAASPSTSQEPSTSPAAAESKPIERQVEARNADDSMGSMVRSLYFADTFITHGQTNNPSLWAGTNGGHVYIYNVTVPSGDKRNTEPVTSQLAKEIKLKHKAPVLSMAAVDGRMRVLPEALEVQHERAKSPDMSNPHSIIICSEEQLKVFALPSLKPRYKFKLTALDGSRIRKVAFVNFRSRSDENYSEFDITCLTNLGSLSIYTVTILRQQLTASAIRKEDINGILSFIFTKEGQGFYLSSPSEFTRISLSARANCQPQCELEIAEGARIELNFPPEPEPQPEPEPSTEDDKPASGEAESEQPAADQSSEPAPADTSVMSTDSQMNTTADITQDTIIVADANESTQSAPTEAADAGETETTTTTSRTVNGNLETIVTTTTVVETLSSGETVQTETQETITREITDNVDDDTKVSQTKVEIDEAVDKLGELKVEQNEDDAVKSKTEKIENVDAEVITTTVETHS